MSRAPDSSKIKLKRVYEPASPTDGTRILVDRLWPRGLIRKMPQSIIGARSWRPAPHSVSGSGTSPNAGKNSASGIAELAAAPEALAELRAFARKGPITLLFAAHDELRNNAVVVCELLRAKRSTGTVPIKTAGKRQGKP